MELMLVPVIVLMVMYATVRSPVPGVVVAAAFAAAASSIGGRTPLEFAAAVAVAGLVIGLVARARAPASLAVLVGALPVALAVLLRLPERALLKAELDQTLRLQFGDGLPPDAREQMVSLELELIR
jgi:hypothetical protein